MAGVAELKRGLALAVKETQREAQPDSPVYRAAQMQVMRDVAPTDDKRFVLDKLDKIESLVRESLRSGTRSGTGNAPGLSHGSFFELHLAGSEAESIEIARMLEEMLPLPEVKRYQASSDGWEIFCSFAGNLPMEMYDIISQIRDSMKLTPQELPVTAVHYDVREG